MKIKGLLVVLLALLASCASGPKYTEIEKSIVELSTDQGRIYFYRPSGYFGAGIQPAVMLNGEDVGNSTPGGFFYVDREPGDYKVSLSSEVEKVLTFELGAGEEKFVRLTVGMGVIVYRVYPELVDEVSAMRELEGLSYIGSRPYDVIEQPEKKKTEDKETDKEHFYFYGPGMSGWN